MSLDMIKFRVNVLNIEMRRNVVHVVLVGLTKREEVNLSPCNKDKLDLFHKFYKNLERWNDPSITYEFLEAVYLLYANDFYKTQELYVRLELLGHEV
jgi:hypothetical protein